MGLIKEKLDETQQSIDAIIHRIGSLVDIYNKGDGRKSTVILAIVTEAEKLHTEHYMYHAYYYCANVEETLEKGKEK
jgi:fatty-acid desaturase